MSFITKRERVFNEYDLFDLPARNEGKLKAYASCTDARAWSHFCSDKTEHLVNVIKRNNETIRPKYIPTDVIVNTLMTSKNAEIARLKRKIEEFEQMLVAYDQLDLTSDQKCDIANAHAAIKAANKELDEMCLDLDLSGFTEGIDSEAFETGKSRGDEVSRYTSETGKSRGDEWTMVKVSTPKMETKSNQIGSAPTCRCDVSTSAHDKRVDELQEIIITKDAKLSAMQNTIAVMENDVCEPYCVYANIYTALEKIFGTLCQNEKYKQYLDLLTTGKDTRSIDITGKIIFKLKVLEKFCLALIAPCSQDFSSSQKDCTCYHAEIVTHIETTFALTSAERKMPNLDSKRAQLVADIMQNDDMKEILSKESVSIKLEDDPLDDSYPIQNYSIDNENLMRLKSLQANYDDLLNCFENLKHERDTLFIRCQKYADLESECDCLQNKLKEYNQLWKDKEYYRKRSADLDALKENFYVLSEETLSIETKFKAEQEINKIKSATVDELRNENIKLENKISEISLSYVKQRNALIVKLKDCECKIMLQEQQIKSLTTQIDSLLEGENDKVANENDKQSMELIDEIKSQKEQIRNLKDALCCNEEEKQYLQEEFEKKLEVVNELKFEIEDWKSKYEKSLEIANYLEKYSDKCNVQVTELQNNNRKLSIGIEKKASAIENLNSIICSKSQEINYLIDEVDQLKCENQSLEEKVKIVHENFENKMASFENEKKLLFSSIHAARKESQEIFENVNNYDNALKKNSKESINSMRQMDCQTDKVGNFSEEMQLLLDINFESIHTLQRENIQLKQSYEKINKENEKFKDSLSNQEDLKERFEDLRKSHENLLSEKNNLQYDLNNKSFEIDNVLHAFQLTKKESESLIDQLRKTESIQEEYIKLNDAYQTLINDRTVLQNKFLQVEIELKELRQSHRSITEENEGLRLNLTEFTNVKNMLSNLCETRDKLQEANAILQQENNNKSEKIKDMYQNFEKKIDDNRSLNIKIKNLEELERTNANKIDALNSEKSNLNLKLNTLHNEHSDLIDKLNYYKHLECNFNNLVLAQDNLNVEKEKLQNELQMKLEEIKKIQKENINLDNERQTLLSHNEDLEKALINCRNEKSTKSDSLHVLYEDIKKEINSLQEEKQSYHKKIRDLRDKLDDSEYLTSNLNEAINAKDKKISTLENHINELEDEIRKLQCDLDKVIVSGEEIRTLSSEKIDRSVKTIEAHHSKATHNMKMELAQLKSQNVNLEGQLSFTKLITEESRKEKTKYVSQIKDLQEEINSIILNIKQLEIRCLGDSNISHKNCTVHAAIISLGRISTYIDDKNMSVENTLSNVQASYQLLKSKAEEAKYIAEKERQKIINEKEEIQRERKNIAEQLEDLKNDKENYDKIVKDLEGEMLNQKLIFERVKQLNENDIIQLKEDNKSLQDLYENILKEKQELQEKLDNETEDKNNFLKLIEEANSTIENKNVEILSLQKDIDAIKNKANRHLAIQTSLVINNQEVACQSESPEQTVSGINTENISLVSTRVVKNLPEILQINDITKENIEFSKELNTNIAEPTINIVKDTYVKYKIKRLSLGRLELISITDSHSSNVSDFNELKKITNTFKAKYAPINSTNYNDNNDNVVNIYSTQILTDSTKNTCETDNVGSINQTEDLKSTAVIDSEYSNDVFVDSLKEEINENAACSDSMVSTDKDLFLIYKDSQSINGDHAHTGNKSWPQNGFNKVIVERAAIYSKDDPFSNARKLKSIQNINDQSQGEENDDDSLRPKLKINLPRVFTDPSTLSISQENKKSIDSYASPTWTHPDVKINNNDSKENIKSYFNDAFTTENKKQNSHESNKTSFFNHKINSNKYTVEIKPFNRGQWSSDNLGANNNQIMESHSSSKSISNITTSLPRVNAETAIFNNIDNGKEKQAASKIAPNYISGAAQNNIDLRNRKSSDISKSLQKSHSEEGIYNSSDQLSGSYKLLPPEHKFLSFDIKPTKYVTDRGILVKLDIGEEYENKIKQLSKALENTEKDYKRKMEAIKTHYDSNVKHIINEHNQGVESIQNLHEETIHEIIKKHENEIENLRTMSIEAMRRAERLENENRCLRSKLTHFSSESLDETPVKILTPEFKKKKGKSRTEGKTLTKTIVDAFNVKPKRRSHGPCTCSLHTDISNTIRNIFEQVDVKQRNMAEIAYLKYIANKIFNDNIEVLDAQELSFLHLKVCRTWKAILNKEEFIQKRIDSLETELMKKQRQTQKHMADLDRKVSQEWRRLQEIREAICRSSPNMSRDSSPLQPVGTSSIAEKEDVCDCNSLSCNITVEQKRSAGDLDKESSCGIRNKRGKTETKRIIGKLDIQDNHIEKRFHGDEAPTRLKRSHDRQLQRPSKK